MKISLATLLSVRDLLPAEPALATVLGGAYADPEYAPTQSDINAAADLIDKWYGEITPIGQETVLMQEQTPESYMDARRDNNNQVFALLEVIHICGLKTPLALFALCGPVS